MFDPSVFPYWYWLSSFVSIFCINLFKFKFFVRNWDFLFLWNTDTYVSFQTRLNNFIIEFLETLKSRKSWGAVYKPRGQNFGQFCPPSPLCGHFYKIAVIKCCGHLSNPPPSPTIWPRGLYMPPIYCFQYFCKTNKDGAF